MSKLFGNRIATIVQKKFIPFVRDEILRHSPLEPSTESLVIQYLNTPARKWKRRRELRDLIASSAIAKHLEKSLTKNV